jgi:hypothetical protein
MFVVDDKRHFRHRGVGAEPVVAAHTDDQAVIEGHQGHAALVVDAREELGFLSLQRLLDPEEAEVPALVAEPPVKRDELVSILRFDRTNLNHVSVGQDRIEFVFGRIARHPPEVSGRRIRPGRAAQPAPGSSGHECFG